MKGAEQVSMTALLREAQRLCKERDNEASWSRMDSVLCALHDRVQTRDEGRGAMASLDLMLTALQSSRSKLSGSGSRILRRMSEVLEEEMGPYALRIVPALVAVSGKANRVISLRAEEALRKMCEVCNVDPAARFLRGAISGPSKLVRSNVSMAVAAALQRKEKLGEKGAREYGPLIKEGLKDGCSEVRANSRRALQCLRSIDEELFHDLFNALDEKAKKVVALALKPPAPASSDKTPDDSKVPASAENQGSRDNEGAKARPPGTTRVIRDNGSGVGIILRAPSRPAPVPGGRADPGHGHRRVPVRSLGLGEGAQPTISSINRIGKMFMAHQREIEEIARREREKGERTPKKAERQSAGDLAGKKRQRGESETPVNLAKKEKENTEEVCDVSMELQNLTINTVDNDNTTVVAYSEIHDDIFEAKGTNARQGSAEFIQSAFSAIQSTPVATSDSESSKEPDSVLAKPEAKGEPNNEASGISGASSEGFSGIAALRALADRGASASDASQADKDEGDYTEINSRILVNKKTTRKHA